MQVNLYVSGKPKHPSSHVRANRRNVLIRDKHRCQYCGRGPTAAGSLTIDHVLPQSRGGVWEWGNLVRDGFPAARWNPPPPRIRLAARAQVAACNRCNNKKGGKNAG